MRWWLLGDGRAGLVETPSGRATRLDDRVCDDLDAALAALREAGLRALFVLTDFLWFAPSRVVDGVQTGGRRHLVRDPQLRSELVEGVFAPLARRYGAEDAIAGWDLCNEPEWATLARRHPGSPPLRLPAPRCAPSCASWPRPSARTPGSR